MSSLMIMVISLLLVVAVNMALLSYADDAFNGRSASSTAARLVKEGHLIAGAVQLAEQDQVATDKIVELSIDDLKTGGYLQAVPASYVTMKADALSAVPGFNFNFTAGKRVFTNGVTVADDVCEEVNEKAGFKAADTASPTDTDTDLVVSVATDAGSKVYGCDTTTKKVFYNF